MQYPQLLEKAVISADRLRERMRAIGLSHAELARRFGVTQPTIFKLVSGGGYSSKHLHRIARELATTISYLTGEIDDPDEGAPPALPEPRSQALMMRVEFPSENALAAMFEAQLRVYGSLQGAELARALAKRLPKAIARLQEVPLFEEWVAAPEETADDQLRASAPPGSRQARRR